MKDTFKILLIVVAGLFSKSMLGQSSIVVHVFYKKSHVPIAKVHVELWRNGKKVMRLNTDTSGVVKFEAIDTGFYDVTAIYSGYYTYRLKRIKVLKDNTTIANIEMITKLEHRREKKITYGVR